MSIIVIGGGGRGAGKTALVCGLLRAMPETEWTAVKVTSHWHGGVEPIWEETAPGDATDTARYLAAGARRALLVTADEEALSPLVERVLGERAKHGGVIFESNSVLKFLRPDLCLLAATAPWGEAKASYGLVLECMDAMVERAGHDHIIEAEKIAFRLKSLERISPVMLEWVREKLGNRE